MSPALERLENQATFLALTVEEYGGKRGKYLHREMLSILANDLSSLVTYLKAHISECQQILSHFSREIIKAHGPDLQAEVMQFLGIISDESCTTCGFFVPFIGNGRAHTEQSLGVFIYECSDCRDKIEQAQKEAEKRTREKIAASHCNITLRKTREAI